MRMTWDVGVDVRMMWDVGAEVPTTIFLLHVARTTLRPMAQARSRVNGQPPQPESRPGRRATPATPATRPRPVARNSHNSPTDGARATPLSRKRSTNKRPNRKIIYSTCSPICTSSFVQSCAAMSVKPRSIWVACCASTSTMREACINAKVLQYHERFDARKPLVNDRANAINLRCEPACNIRSFDPWALLQLREDIPYLRLEQLLPVVQIRLHVLHLLRLLLEQVLLLRLPSPRGRKRRRAPCLWQNWS